MYILTVTWIVLYTPITSTWLVVFISSSAFFLNYFNLSIFEKEVLESLTMTMGLFIVSLWFFQFLLCLVWNIFIVVKLLSHVWLFVTPWTAARQASLSITNSRSLLKLKSMDSVMPSSHLILCHPLLLLPSIFPSIRVFSNESALHIRWPEYWSFSFSIRPSNAYSGLISFGVDWLDLLAVQGTLKSLLQHHSSKASVLRRSAFFVD